MNAPAENLRFELLAIAGRLANRVDDDPHAPAAGILRDLEHRTLAAVRAVDKLPLPMNVELLSKPPEVVEAGKRVERGVVENFGESEAE